MSPQEGSCRITLGGKGCSDQILGAINESEGISDSTKELWDLIEVSSELDMKQIRMLSVAAQEKRHKPFMTAIVAIGDLHFGLMRMYSAYREDDDTIVAVFRDEIEALKWLGIQDKRDADT